jgi:hypothetical protein
MHPTTRREFLKTTATTSIGTLLLSGSSFGQAVKAKKAKPVKAAPPVDPYADAILKAGPPPMPEQGSFTVVALPDTQGYSMRVPETYIAQTKWIVEQKKRRNIANVLHLGDITNNNTHDQWQNAVAAMKLLDGEVPYLDRKSRQLLCGIRELRPAEPCALTRLLPLRCLGLGDPECLAVNSHLRVEPTTDHVVGQAVQHPAGVTVVAHELAAAFAKRRQVVEDVIVGRLVGGEPPGTQAVAARAAVRLGGELLAKQLAP